MTTRTETDAAAAPTPTPAPEDARIVFVGGTGRSGTHIVAKLLGRSSRYALVPIECRFHVDEDGFPGLLSGAVSKQAFIRRLRRYWWRRPQATRIRGLHRLVPRERFDRAVELFDRRFDSEPERACAQLFLDLLWPEDGPDGPCGGIVEQSCDTIAQAPTLMRLFDDARFVHVVRDGRDASASRVRQARWLPYPGAFPRTRRQGLEWWEQRLRRIDPGARAIPKQRLVEVELGQLFVPGNGKGSGRHQVRRLARIAGVASEPAMKGFARHRMSSELANEERWRRGLSERRQREIEARYVAILDRLERDRIKGARRLRRAYERQ